MRIRDPKPEIQRLEELVSAIRSGEIRLPKFQRPFVWSKSDVLNLFDSIYNGYPIGSILLWHSSERMNSEREISGFKLAESENLKYPTDYLLDGQQRLTSLCATLYWDGNDESSIWNIHFDLDEETFLYPKNEVRPSVFPMNKLLSTKEFIKQCMKFDNTNNPTKYYEKAERLLKQFKDYKIAVVKIGDVTLDEVAPIFERINSTGRKLTVVDLMRAATWKNDFDLSSSINEIIENHKNVFGEISDTHILKSIAASSNLGINKADIDKLRKLSTDELKVAVSKTNDALSMAIEFFREEICLTHISYLPYGLQLILITEYFRLNKRPNSSNISALRRWFWRTTLSRYFSGANTGQISKDISQIRQFAANEVNDIKFDEYPINIDDLIWEDFNSRTSSSKALSLLLKYSIEKKSSKNRKIHHIRSDFDRSLFISIMKDTEYSGLNISQCYDPKLIDDLALQISKSDWLEANFISSSNFGDSPISSLMKRAESIRAFVQELAEISDEKIRMNLAPNKR